MFTIFFEVVVRIPGTIIVLQVLSFVAENERSNIRQRQAEGIETARQRGVRFGRPTTPLPESFYAAYQRWRAKLISVTEAAEECGMPRSTFYHKAQLYEKSRNISKNPETITFPDLSP